MKVLHETLDLEPQVLACDFPAVFVAEQNLCITGLCSVLRFVIAGFSQAQHLLGHQSNCLSAPAEVSTWTKFCEIDLPRATQEILQGEVSNRQIPFELAQFEIHLRQPVKIHNIRKRMQQAQMQQDKHSILQEDGGRQVSLDEKGRKVDAIVVFAQEQHLYAEGPDFLLSDAILLPHYYLIMHRIPLEVMTELLPKTLQWYDRCLQIYNQHLQDTIGLKTVKLSHQWQLDMSQVPNQSLYKCDPKRLNPSARIFTRQPDIDRAMASVAEAGIEVLEAVPYDFTHKIDWDSLPELVHPLGGELPQDRLEKKCQQLENLASAVLSIAQPGQVLVDFCSGGGHLAILLAYLLPQVTVYLVENKQQSLLRAIKRVQALGLENCRFYQGNMDYFQGRFDIGVSLHACGVATDLVIQSCIRNRASFVSCPCCYGSVQANHMLGYPRSRAFQDIAFKDYLTLGHTADQTHGSNDKEAQGRKAMNIIDTDRITAARETGLYSNLRLVQLRPSSCTPKNNLIIGLIKS